MSAFLRSEMMETVSSKGIATVFRIIFSTHSPKINSYSQKAVNKALLSGWVTLPEESVNRAFHLSADGIHGFPPALLVSDRHFLLLCRHDVALLKRRHSMITLSIAIFLHNFYNYLKHLSCPKLLTLYL